jgi:hypothetical protein
LHLVRPAASARSQSWQQAQQAPARWQPFISLQLGPEGKKLRSNQEVYVPTSLANGNTPTALLMSGGQALGSPATSGLKSWRMPFPSQKHVTMWHLRMNVPDYQYIEKKNEGMSSHPVISDVWHMHGVLNVDEKITNYIDCDKFARWIFKSN